jgi:hypothetical protein
MKLEKGKKLLKMEARLENRIDRKNKPTMG